MRNHDVLPSIFGRSVYRNANPSHEAIAANMTEIIVLSFVAQMCIASLASAFAYTLKEEACNCGLFGLHNIYATMA